MSVMASSFSSAMLPLLFLLPCAAAVSASAASYLEPAGGGGTCFTRMFVLGDSISDTGNLAPSASPNASYMKLPYGETFFQRPTGRFSDGRLTVDFIAEALQLPFVTPYLAGETTDDFRHGANFAVAGATALSQEFYIKAMGLDVPLYSLEVQMQEFKHMLHQLASTDQERKEIMSKSLFFMGEIGGNDYNLPFLMQNRSITEMKPLVPKVIKNIENSIKVLIDLGAKTIVVPAFFPMGCVPKYLAVFQSENPNDYDEFGCLKWPSDFSKQHNKALKNMMENIRPHDATVAIIYADYYGALLEATQNPIKHGFRKESILTACCGDGGPYNSGTLSCNGDTSILCPNPSEYVSWDGMHYTEALYRFMARGVLEGPYAEPTILSRCRTLHFSV